MANFAEMINGDQPVLVDFYADWCGPCKMMAPVLDELSKEVSGQAKVLKVDVDKNQKASQVYQIKSIPTIILFKKGKVVWRHSGTAGKEQLKSIIQANL
ncbi:MAG: thioredoxin [Reichenbachiella sp.]